MKKSRKRNQPYPHARQRRQASQHRDPPRARHDHSGSGYVARVAAAAASGGIVKAGEVTSVTVNHQLGCARPHGGPCTCQPDIECVDASGNVHVVGVNGEVTSRTRLN